MLKKNYLASGIFCQKTRGHRSRAPGQLGVVRRALPSLPVCSALGGGARRSHTYPPGCRVAYIHGTRVRVRRHCPFPEKPSLDPFPRPRFFLSNQLS